MQIPTINSSEGKVDTGSTGPNASAIDFGWGDSDGARSLQVAADRTGQQLEDVYEKANAATAQNALVQAEVDWTNNLNNAKTGTGPHNTPDFMQGFNDYIDKTASGMNAQAADMFRSHMQTMGVGVYKQSLHIEASKAALDSVGNAQKNYQALTGLVSNNPATLPDAMALVDNGKPSLPTNSPAVANSSTEAAKTQLVGAAVSGSLLLSDPNQADSVLNDPSYNKYLDPGYKNAAQNQVQLQAKVNTQLSKEDLVAARKSNFQSIMETGQPVDGYDMMRDAANNAKNPNQAAELYNKLVDSRNAAMLVYQAKTATFGKNYADGTAALDALKPDPGDPAFAIKEAAYRKGVIDFNQGQQKLRTDPYQYTLDGSPTIKDLQTRADSSFASGDFQTGVGLQTQAIRQSLAIQTQAGIPPNKQSVVSKAQATSLAGSIVNGAPADGLGAFDRINTTYGPYAGKVLTQMQQLPEKDRLPASYQIVAANLDDRAFATTMLSAIRSDSANKAALEGNPAAQGLNNQVFTDPTFTQYADALRTANPDADRYSSEVGQGITSLARSYVVGSKVASGAPNRAVRDVITRSYGIQANPDGSHYLIPAKQYTADDQANIASYLSESLNSIGKTGTFMQAGDLTPIDPQSVNHATNLDSETSKNLTYNAIPKNAYWATIPDGSGVQLFVNTPDGRIGRLPGVPVRAVGGSPVIVRYSQAKAEMDSRKAPANPNSGWHPAQDFQNYLSNVNLGENE